ncbi:alpha/beta hydrolase [Herbaspirillum sp. meg3]|jgi:pimeloyl-ACP methyl ester carboxylesterase|uniref:alpha/beta fold hydrolase n=1 Tax=Herbaspirillum sp. meg3 TaxID=2025949 RepID=UPI000B990A73|nr:alpha/beta hydrolase [Herbaspirillum sp. meg3]ASU37778.1 alpha/beta hydrolase [Herbaspirillum sp. meg3]
MATITTRDGTEIYFKDWGKGQPVIFSHGWPLDADMWEYQMNFLAEKGYRVIAYDRRGFGRSSQPWDGYNYDTFADDLAELIEALDLKEAVLVGFSMGGGDVARYIGRHGVKRLSKAVLVGAVTPIFIKTDNHPEGVPKEVFDGIKDGLRADRAQFLSDFSSVFYGTNRPDSKVSAGVLAQTLNIALLASLKGTIDCVTAFSETDFREDMKKFTLPTLVIHGDDDQVVPLEATGKLAAAAVPGSQLKVYPGAPHALCFTHKDQLNLDLLGFLQAR